MDCVCYGIHSFRKSKPDPILSLSVSVVSSLLLPIFKN